MNRGVLLVLILSTLLLTGCWNYVEVEKLSIVAGMAVDKNPENNDYEITAEIIDVNSSDSQSSFSSIIIQAKGKTIFDSIRNMIAISSKRLYWSHATTIIVSKDVAKDGIFPVLDWAIRDSELRANLHILIAETPKAKDILNLEPISTQIRSYEIESIISSSRNSSKIPDVRLYEIVNNVSSEGASPIVPAVDEVLNEGKKTMTLSGAAILDKDKFAGFIDLGEVRNYLFVKNQIRGGILPISLGNIDSKPNLSLEIFKNKTTVTPVILNGNLAMDINIKTDVAIAELDIQMDPLNKSDVKEIKIAGEEWLENSILGFINRIQEDYALDIFGFGNKVKEEMPQLWKEIASDWDDIFRDLEVKVNADFHIRGSGHTSKTIDCK